MQRTGWQGQNRYQPYERREARSAPQSEQAQPWRQFARGRGRNRGRGRSTNPCFSRPEVLKIRNDSYLTSPTVVVKKIKQLDLEQTKFSQGKQVEVQTNCKVSQVISPVRTCLNSKPWARIHERSFTTPVPSPQTEQEMEIHSRSKSVEPVPQHWYFQDGNSGNNPNITSKRGVCHIVGLQRRVFPHSHPSQLLQVHEVLSEQANLSVYCPSFWKGCSMHRSGVQESTST